MVNPNSILAALALAVGAPTFILGQSLKFPDTEINATSNAQTISISNQNSSYPITFSISISGKGFQQGSGTTCGLGLSSGQSCVYNVVFAPVYPSGPKTGTVTIDYHLISGYKETWSLTGNAIEPPPPPPPPSGGPPPEQNGRKFDPKDIGLIGNRSFLLERSNANGTFTALSGSLDPGFAYWASLPDSKVFAGNFRGVATDLMVVTANGLAYSEASNLNGSFRIFALGSHLPNFIATALGAGAKFVVGDLLGTGRDCILAFGGSDRTAAMAVGRTDGTFEDKIISLDPGFAYWASLPDSIILSGKFH